MEDNAKRYRDSPKWGIVKNNIGKQSLYLPENCVPVTKSRLKSLELENPVKGFRSALFLRNAFHVGVRQRSPKLI